MAYVFDASDFFSRLKQGVNKGIRIVNIRSKEAYETLRIKNQLQSLNRQRKSALEELGNAVYRMFKHRNGFNEEAIKARCIEIERIEDEIEESKERLRMVHESAQSALGRLKAISKPRVIGTCECGVEIYEGTEFCGSCFRKVR
jgi:predicted mannosyl-3-phosphoglycerate phosphatase (HAD superfamily)